MMREPWPCLLAIELLLLSGSSAAAQSRCDVDSCSYDFSVPAEGGFPDWSVDSPPEGNTIEVADGFGYLDILSDDGQFYLRNSAHLTWTYAGSGFNAASATFRFAGDNGRMGWFEKLTDGTVSCKGAEHAQRASDEMMLLTLYDDGLNFVGGFIGGDLHAVGELLPPLDFDPPTGFAVMGVLQKLASDDKPRVLKYVQSWPIQMYSAPLHLNVHAWQDANGQWWVEAEARKERGERLYVAKAPFGGQPNLDGLIGLAGTNQPNTYCISKDGGVIDRQYQIGEVTAFHK